ncbi:MAG: methyltransferase domain-containing protein [Candidatus Hydrogenedentes bacterium]|nr:methyltransferase domain-containing protein [Candidatus Hydrogenedentota bacterium]
MNGSCETRDVVNPLGQPGPASFDPAFFKVLHAAEDRHFWFRSRNRIIAAALQYIDAQLQPGYWAIEGGCGSGNTLRVLDHACAKGRIIGADLFGEGFAVARTRSASQLMRLDLSRLPFRRAFSVVALFDVLEHLPDDCGILCAIRDALVEGGWLMLTVPRDPDLWSDTDDFVCHARRYRDTELREKLINSGFDIEYFTPFMTIMRLLLPLSRKTHESPHRGELDRERAHTHFQEELRVRPIVNPIMEAILGLEAHWVRYRKTLPTGASLLVVARKKCA